MDDIERLSEELDEAVYQGDLPKIKNLVELGVPLNGEHAKKYIGSANGCIKGAPYSIPLIRACSSGKHEVIRYLVEQGADVNATNYCTQTPFLIAVESCRRGDISLDIVKYLVNAGAEIHFVGSNGNAMHYGTQMVENRSEELLRYLLELGIDPNLKNDSQSILKKNYDIISLLTGEHSQLYQEKYITELGILKEYWDKDDPEMIQLWQSCMEAIKEKENSDKTESDKWEQLLKCEDWVEQVSRIIDENPLYNSNHFTKSRRTLADLTKRVLKNPESIQKKEWGKIIKKLADQSPSFADLSEEHLFQRIEVFSDEWYNEESGLQQIILDNKIHTIDLCMEVLWTKEAIAREDFTELFIYVLEKSKKKYGYPSWGGYKEEDMEHFLETEHIKAHKDYGKLRKLAEL